MSSVYLPFVASILVGETEAAAIFPNRTIMFLILWGHCVGKTPSPMQYKASSNNTVG